MKSNKLQRSQYKQLCKEFYEIHDAVIETQAEVEKLQEGIQQNRPLQNKQQQYLRDTEQTQKMKNTKSTDISDSKIKGWEELTLRQIEEKSENEENENEGQSSFEKYPLFKKDSSSVLEETEQKMQSKMKDSKPSKSKKKSKKCKNKSEPKIKPTKNQLLVTLLYPHEHKVNRYIVGMKTFNHEWFQYLNNIHKQI